MKFITILIYLFTLVGCSLLPNLQASTEQFHRTDFATKTGFLIDAPSWLHRKYYKEIGRIIDEMWIVYKRHFSASHINPKLVRIKIHEKLGSFEWKKDRRVRGLCWSRWRLIVVAWSVTSRGQVDLKRTLKVLYHEWAHLTFSDSDTKHKSPRWAKIKKLRPISWDSKIKFSKVKRRRVVN